MSVYETLRHFADSYALVVMLAIFVTLAFSFMMMLVPLALIPISMMGY